LGAVLKDLKEFEAAVEVFEKAIKGRLATEGESSNGYAMAKAMAAGAYRDMENYEKADEYLRDAYLQISLAFGENNATASAILNSWGLLYKKRGKFDRALDAYQRALTVRLEIFGAEHPETCTTRHNIGELYIEMGKHEEAKAMFEENLTLMEKKTQEEREAHE
jgi:tetratricopeptide (TPR) repeat protein